MKQSGAFSTMKAPKSIAPITEREKTRLEELEASEAREKLDVRKAKADKIAQFLEYGPYVTDYTWPWFAQTVRGYTSQMSVALFFPKQGVAVDKFMDEQEFEAANVSLRKKLMKDNGVKYAYAYYGNSLADIVVQLENQ